MAFIPEVEEKIKYVENIGTKTSDNPDIWKEDSTDQMPNPIFSIRGFQKVGKTYLIMSSVFLHDIDLGSILIKTGKPTYYIDFENAAKIERDHHFKENKNDIVIKNPIIKKKNGKIDYLKSFNQFKSLISALSDKTVGCLCIDGFRFVSEATWYILIDNVLGYGFDETTNKANKEPLPHEHVWRKKEFREMLTLFRSMKIPIFLTNTLKSETEQTDKFFKRTGKFIEDVPDGTQYFYDMEITIEKEIENNKYVRIAKIFDSRFEEAEVPVLRYTIKNPDMQKIMEHISKIMKGK